MPGADVTAADNYNCRVTLMNSMLPVTEITAVDDYTVHGSWIRHCLSPTKRRRMTSLPTSTVSLLRMACCKFHLCAANLVGQLGARTVRWRTKDSPRRQWLYSSGPRDRRRSKDSAGSLMWRLTDLLLHRRCPYISVSLMVTSPVLAIRKCGKREAMARAC